MSHATPDALRTVAFPVKGMDCMECTQHVQQALCTLPGVVEVIVSLSSEKAIVRYDPAQVDMSAFRKAVEGAGYGVPRQTVELRIAGMDCAECTQHVQHALAALPGVEDVRVLLSSEKAVLQIDPTTVDLATIRKAVEGAGYTVPEHAPSTEAQPAAKSLTTFTRPILTLFGLVFGAVL